MAWTDIIAKYLRKRWVFLVSFWFCDLEEIGLVVIGSISGKNAHNEIPPYCNILFSMFAI